MDAWAPFPQTLFGLLSTMPFKSLFKGHWTRNISDAGKLITFHMHNQLLSWKTPSSDMYVISIEPKFCSVYYCASKKTCRLLAFKTMLNKCIKKNRLMTIKSYFSALSQPLMQTVNESCGKSHKEQEASIFPTPLLYSWPGQ